MLLKPEILKSTKNARWIRRFESSMKFCQFWQYVAYSTPNLPENYNLSLCQIGGSLRLHFQPRPVMGFPIGARLHFMQRLPVARPDWWRSTSTMDTGQQLRRYGRCVQGCSFDIFFSDVLTPTYAVSPSSRASQNFS